MKMLCSTSALFITATLVAGCGTQPRSGGSVETAGSVPTPVVDSTSKSGNGRYSSVNGLNMYYEVHGSGPPLVLLHGAFTTIDSAWAKLLPSLAKSRQVIAIEQQGHGHTADIDRPITYEQMAEDTAALLRELKIEQADVMGWSMGGTIALRLAMRHPGLVRKLVVIAGHYNNQGWDPAQFEAFKNLPADFAPKELKEPYDRVAPNPNQWPGVVAKFKKTAVEFRGWRPEDIKAIKAHTMVMMGDRDVFLPEHAVQLLRLIPNAQLAVLPGSDHFAVWTHPDWLLPMITAFLDAPIPKGASQAKNAHMLNGSSKVSLSEVDNSIQISQKEPRSGMARLCVGDKREHVPGSFINARRSVGELSAKSKESTKAQSFQISSVIREEGIDSTLLPFDTILYFIKKCAPSGVPRRPIPVASGHITYPNTSVAVT